MVAPAGMEFKQVPDSVGRATLGHQSAPRKYAKFSAGRRWSGPV